MSENTTGRTDGKPEEVSLWDYFYVLYKWRKFIVVNVFILTLIAVVVALLLPVQYKATATVIAPRKTDIFGGLGMFSQSIREFAPFLRGLSGTQLPLFTYLAILNSRTAMEKVVNKFDLIKVYGIKDSSVEKAVKKLRGNTDFEIDENGVLVINVYDEDRRRAADMANYFVEVLNEINIKLNIEEAKNNRIVIERRYLQNLADLKAAEDTLKKFQQRYGIYYLPEQAKAAVEAAAELEAQIIAEEVKLGILQRQLGDDASEVRAVKIQIEEMKKRLNQMKEGNERLKNEMTLFVPFKNMPELGLQYLRLYREYEIQNKLLEFIVPLYEQAKIEEQKNIPVVQVLDYAVPPEKKARPFRTLIVLSVFASALVLFVIIAFVNESFLNRKQFLNSLDLKAYNFVRKVATLYKIS
ncbi:Capsule polysaccharide export protein KpsE/RkpR [Candidatus Kryptobacter tengchongensis]|nr:Capsule polysaccharide export protein KpsE/RkpR [Candidatus Kryptobacter tengchongensis]